MAAHQFTVNIEVVPPAGSDPRPLLATLKSLEPLNFEGFSVATNPVARPRMSAMALSVLIGQETRRPASPHVTTRDHSRIGLQGQLWGAVALGIERVLVATGDMVALGDRTTTSNVADIDVFGLVEMSRTAGLQTGVVLDPQPGPGGLEREIKRLKRKVEAGAQFVVTQPVYDEASVDELAEALHRIAVPAILGILPLRTARHAEFLHGNVAGINVPESVLKRMHESSDTVAEGAANAREMLVAAQERFSGAFLMPPFGRYSVLFDILENEPPRNPVP